MNEFSQYIKLIGKGKRAGKYLSQTQAYDAFKMVLNQQAEPEQIGAFLMLLRVREESEEELAGFVQESGEYVSTDLKALNIDIDLGCYAGKRRHLPWFILAVACLAERGYKLFLHGCAEPDSQRLYLDHVLPALNIPISSSYDEAEQSLEKRGFVYMDLASVNSKLHALINLRSLFGLRSPANTLARMLNPTDAPYSFHGVFHKHFDERHVAVAKLLGDKQVSCIRGEGGEVEVNPERPFTQYLHSAGGISKVEFPALLDSWQIKPATLNPNELLEFWRGELESEYGTQAVIGTIASMLVLKEKLTMAEALSRAIDYWQERDKSSL